ncbi:MAG: arginyl-tRNA--protein-N-Asp/Glu arginylyltransferase [Halieaceae bacterium]|jgi:arginyl-tRNA--protein-N-Asp/Glu arginylyltransferase
MSSLGDLKIYTTHPHSCSYLVDKQATTLFIDPQTSVDKKLYSSLSLLGFRRSGSYLYRPHCVSCQACTPTRIPVSTFKPSRSQRRCWAHNQDLQITQVENIDTDEHYSLYERYIELRHSDGDMYPAEREQFRSFLSSQWGTTRYLEFRLEGKLLSVAVSDELEDGLSAIYTYFESDTASRSLGTYAVLQQIERAKLADLPYLYLGYWIKDCQKMSYKTQFRPFQLLQNNRWADAGLSLP